MAAVAMKIVYMGIITSRVEKRKVDDKEVDVTVWVELAVAKDVSEYGYFQRGSVSEFLTMMAKNMAERTKPGQREAVEHKELLCHTLGRSEGICSVIITSPTYPDLVSRQLVGKIADEFLATWPRSAWANVDKPDVPFPALEGHLKTYQDPHQADSIMKIQQQLDETKEVLHKTIDSVLTRGENINDLVAKSEDLSAHTKLFLNSAKAQNKCCIIM